MGTSSISHRKAIAAGLAVAIGATAGWAVAARDQAPASVGAHDAAGQSSTTLPPIDPPSDGVEVSVTTRDVRIVVDPSLAGADGTLLSDDGTRTTMALDELVVVAPDEASFAAFMDRWPLTELERSTPEPDGSFDALVRVNSLVDASGLTADIAATEPEMAGEHRVSSEQVLTLMTISSAEAVRDDVVVLPNFGADSFDEAAEAAIRRDASTEGGETNPFEWSYLRDGSTQDFGVVGAWNILEHHDDLTHIVDIGVHDGGFIRLPDHGPFVTLRKDQWNTPNARDCSGSPCPWHGTTVAQVALGRLDDGDGVAGPAGPTGELTAIGGHEKYSYQRIAKLPDLVAEEGIDILNMSWGGTTKYRGAVSERWLDRSFGKMWDNGVVLIAAAGNDGVDVDRPSSVCDGPNSCREAAFSYPCESKYVLCVGGVAWDSVAHHSSSNFGTAADNKTVEIYGPYQVYVNEITDEGVVTGAIKRRSGTSYSAPFVAGIAALLKTPDLSISNAEIVDLLLSTSRPVVTDANLRSGHRRLVNAREAVAALYDIDVTVPTLTLEMPVDGTVLAPDGWVEVRATATDYLGRPLKWWALAGNQDLGVAGPFGSAAAQLPPGTHAVIVQTEDYGGRQPAPVVVHVTVEDNPAELTIHGIDDGDEFLAGQPLQLVGTGQDPDDWTMLDDSALIWGLAHDGDYVATAEGGQTTLDLPDEPGTYQLVLGANGVAAVEATVTIEVLPVPENWVPPVIQILEPVGGTRFATDSSQEVTIDLRGRAFRNGRQVPGTQLRWVATAEGASDVVICEGAAFHADPDGGIAAGPVASCGTTTATLGLGNVVGATVWTIRLEVFDAQVDIDPATSVDVLVEYIAG